MAIDGAQLLEEGWEKAFRPLEKLVDDVAHLHLEQILDASVADCPESFKSVKHKSFPKLLERCQSRDDLVYLLRIARKVNGSYYTSKNAASSEPIVRASFEAGNKRVVDALKNVILWANAQLPKAEAIDWKKDIAQKSTQIG